MTALSIMAMASVGIQPVETSPEGQVMARALQFVLREDRVDKNGYFGNRDGSRMYGHGIITLMLTEMLGMGTTADEDRLIHDRCQAAIDVILASQKNPQADALSWRLALYTRITGRGSFGVRLAADGTAIGKE